MGIVKVLAWTTAGVIGFCVFVVALILGSKPIAYSVAVAAACFIVASLLPSKETNDTNKAKPTGTSTAQTKPVKKRRRSLTEEETTYRDDRGKSREKVWLVFRFDPDPALKSPKWVALKRFDEINVTGTRYHLDACRDFFDSARSDEAIIQLKPDATFTPPAFAVWAKPQNALEAVHIGYLPREISERLHEEFSQDMPLAARLRRAGIHRTEEAYFFSVVLVGPPTKDVAKYRRD